MCFFLQVGDEILSINGLQVARASEIYRNLMWLLKSYIFLLSESYRHFSSYRLCFSAFLHSKASLLEMREVLLALGDTRQKCHVRLKVRPFFFFFLTDSDSQRQSPRRKKDKKDKKDKKPALTEKKTFAIFVLCFLVRLLGWTSQSWDCDYEEFEEGAMAWTVCVDLSVLLRLLRFLRFVLFVPSIHILLDLYLHTNFISFLENSLAVWTSCGIWCQSKSNFDTVSEHLHFKHHIFVCPETKGTLSDELCEAQRTGPGNRHRSTSCSSWTPGVWKTGRHEFGTKSFEMKLFWGNPIFLDFHFENPSIQSTVSKSNKLRMWVRACALGLDRIFGFWNMYRKRSERKLHLLLVSSQGYRKLGAQGSSLIKSQRISKLI